MARPHSVLPAFLAAIAMLGVAGDSFAAPASADPPETPESFARDQTEMLTQLRGNTPQVPSRSVGSMLHFDLVDGHLEATLADSKVPDDSNFLVDNDPAEVLALSVRHIATRPPVDLLNAHLMRYDAPAGRSVNVEVLPAIGAVNLTVTIQTLSGTTIAQLVEQSPRTDVDSGPPLARLYLSRTDTPNAADVPSFNFAEPSFAALVTAHHDEALAMLGEGLTSLRAMHVLSGVSLADARAIFAADRPIDDAASKQLDSILADLEKGGSAAVPELRTRLRQLGPAAAAALNRRPRDQWSVDLALNVDTLTAGLLAGDRDRGAALLASPARMFDLLYAPEVSIRTEALKRLQAGTKEKLSIDVTGDPYAQVAQIEVLRLKVVPAAH